jgi:hypothetical protein
MLLLAVVKDEELARHLLFDLDHFTKWNSLHYNGEHAKVRVCMRRQLEREEDMDEPLPLLVETRCRVNLLVIPCIFLNTCHLL